MSDYSLLARRRELSSLLGLVLIALALYLGHGLPPGDADALLTHVLGILGAFGIAIPDRRAIDGLQAAGNLVLDTQAGVFPAPTTAPGAPNT